jgi:DNA-binding response OmpR family regulator
LLRYLYTHKNQVCTRRAIAADVFDAVYPAHVSDDEVDELEGARIEQNISRLRAEIERDPKQPKYIETIRGQGYRLNQP